MFLLVPAYPGCPGSKAVKRSLLLLLLLLLLTSFPVPSRDHSTTCITVHIFSVLMIAHCWHLEEIVSVLNAVFSCIQ